MRKNLLILVVVLASAGTGVRAQEIESGFYALVESGGVIVKGLDGSELHLGVKLTDKIEKATIRSTRNDNERFRLRVDKATPFSADVKSITLCPGGPCVRFDGSGSSPGVYSIDVMDTDRKTADAIAKFFGITLMLRSHPGYALAVRFVPAKESFYADEPLLVTMEIANVGAVPVTFMVGGANRGARDNQFGFTAFGPTGAVPDTGDPNHAGGISFNRTLTPGDTFSKVDVSKWFALKAEWTYALNGTYRLFFHNPADNDYVPIWEDQAAASFRVTIK